MGGAPLTTGKRFMNEECVMTDWNTILKYHHPAGEPEFPYRIVVSEIETKYPSCFEEIADLCVEKDSAFMWDATETARRDILVWQSFRDCQVKSDRRAKSRPIL